MEENETQLSSVFMTMNLDWHFVEHKFWKLGNFIQNTFTESRQILCVCLCVTNLISKV